MTRFESGCGQAGTGRGFWFENFDLEGVDDIRFQPISDRLLVRNLRDQTQRELARALEGPREARVENYIVKYLMDYPQVDYDSQADLLYKLAGQMVAHLRSYLQTEDDVENVALANGKTLAQRIFAQMKAHYRQTPAEYRASKIRSFRTLEPQNISYSPARSLMLGDQATPLSATPSFTFRGGRKSPYKFHKFHSDPERRFAVMIDSDFEKDVLRWLKPARNQFRIEYQPGKPYEPDFVIETTAEKLIVEIKAENMMSDMPRFGSVVVIKRPARSLSKASAAAALSSARRDSASAQRQKSTPKQPREWSVRDPEIELAASGGTRRSMW